MHKKNKPGSPAFAKMQIIKQNRRIPAEKGMRRLAFDSLVLIRFI